MFIIGIKCIYILSNNICYYCCLCFLSYSSSHSLLILFISDFLSLKIFIVFLISNYVNILSLLCTFAKLLFYLIKKGTCLLPDTYLLPLQISIPQTRSYLLRIFKNMVLDHHSYSFFIKRTIICGIDLSNENLYAKKHLSITISLLYKIKNIRCFIIEHTIFPISLPLVTFQVLITQTYHFSYHFESRFCDILRYFTRFSL